MYLIHNPNQLRSWIDLLSSVSDPDDVFFVQLNSRNKYRSGKNGFATGEGVLAQFDCKLSNLHNRLLQMESDAIVWTLGGLTVEYESLVVYMTPNPRCIAGAHKATIKKLVDGLCSGQQLHPTKVAQSCVHKSVKSNKPFVVFDFDCVTVEEQLEFARHITSDLIQIFGNLGVVHKVCRMVETRSGYHLIVQPKQLPIGFANPKWFDAIRRLGADQSGGDFMTPIPGTIQGGKVPILWEIPELSIHRI